jgi:hypothetical protein
MRLSNRRMATPTAPTPWPASRSIQTFRCPTRWSEPQCRIPRTRSRFSSGTTGSASHGPELLRRNTARVDWSVAKGGFLYAYRWDGERELNQRKFMWCYPPHLGLFLLFRFLSALGGLLTNGFLRCMPFLLLESLSGRRQLLL